MKYPDLKTSLEGTFTALSLFSLVLAGAYASKIEAQYNSRQTTAVFLSAAHIHPGVLEAKAAVVYDAKTNTILYAKNADEPLALASLTKVMTAEALLATQDDSTPVPITLEDLAPEGDSGLVVGEVWTLRNLLTFGLVVSSNDAMAAAAASATGTIEAMNSTAATLGLLSMRFANPTGLDVSSTTAGSYGSAHDMARLVSDFLKKYPGLFENTANPATIIALANRSIPAAPTAGPILDIPGLIGAKTGYTDLAGGNLVVAFDIEVGHPVVVVVLGSSREGRFSDMRLLIDAARASVTNQ